MRPENLLSSLVAVYPPEGSNVERAGYLPGERAPTEEKSPQMVRWHLSLSCHATPAPRPGRAILFACFAMPHANSVEQAMTYAA